MKQHTAPHLPLQVLGVTRGSRVSAESRRSEPGTSYAQVVDSICSALKWLFGCVALVVFSYCLRDMVVSLSGKQTHANVLVSFIADVDIHVWVAWGLAVGGCVYGANQQRLRKRQIERLTKKIRAYEKKLDPNRTSAKVPEGSDVEDV
jgi:hypothetical protein